MQEDTRLVFKITCPDIWVERVVHCLEQEGALSVLLEGAEKGTPIVEPLPAETPFWEETQCIGYWPTRWSETAGMERLLQVLGQFLPEAVLGTASFERIEGSQGAEWPLASKVFEFAEKLVVVPPDRTLLRLNQGLGFGTGAHPTTALVLSWLCRHAFLSSDRVLDYGCGSGILGLSALQLGASQVWAVDHDEQAVESTLQNARLNGLEHRMIVRRVPTLADTPLSLAGSFEIVLANISQAILVRLAPILLAHLRPKGHLVLSGLREAEVSTVQSAYQLHFDTQAIVECQDGWALLHFKA